MNYGVLKDAQSISLRENGLIGASLSEPHIVVFSGCPSGGCLFAVGLAYDRISKWKIEILHPARVLVVNRNARQFRVEPATPVLQTTYKLETLDRRERMVSVRKRRKAGRGTGHGKETTMNLKLSADSNERQLAQRSLRTTNVTLHTERSMSYELETADRHQAEAQGTGTINLCSGPTPSPRRPGLTSL